MKVRKAFRNHGYSFGLEYRLIYGRLPQTGRWSIWDRHTGAVVYQVRLGPQLHECLAEAEAMRKCQELNGVGRADTVAIDSTP